MQMVRMVRFCRYLVIVFCIFSSLAWGEDFDSLVVSENGNVGIGTTNPEFALDVPGGDIRFDYGGFIRAGSTAWSNSNSDTKVIGVGWDGNIVKDYLRFYVPGNYSNASSAKMTVLNNGNVGIGTTVPGTRLDVIGTVRSSSGVLSGSPLCITAASATEGGQVTLAYNGNYGHGEGPMTWNIDVYDKELRFFSV